MSQPMGSYDESLLRDAPVATRKQLQEGYTTDLLASHRSLNRTQSPLPDGATAAIPPTALRADLEQGQRSQDGFNHYTPLSEKAIPSSNRIPFWRTTKGIIIIAVLAIIIVGVVVGAAVGTTVHKSQSVTTTNTSNSTTTPAPSNTTSNGQGSGDSGAGVGSGPSTASAGLTFSIPLPKPSGTDNTGNGFVISQSESKAIAAMKQAEHFKFYNRRDAYQASGNVDIS
ncbi:hypothetical protein M378DRAFT_11558 [Amanita muscaria Koide BX008]|uniref:Uncharacterized protein n=1 Tax=Amanita muscaria (strain Koide BX008) TaxID=946122 RepID=A0A0C2X6J4_AMAMK|nr:hypothetical protein M378DRAFT_11558 [Amanita muscaria Koide BX008]